jgi:hypothetical protein
MVLVEEDTVVMHTSGVTTTSGMLSVFSDTTVSGADVAVLLPVLLESGCHCCCCPLSHSGSTDEEEEPYFFFIFLILLFFNNNK